MMGRTQKKKPIDAPDNRAQWPVHAPETAPAGGMISCTTGGAGGGCADVAAHIGTAGDAGGGWGGGGGGGLQKTEARMCCNLNRFGGALQVALRGAGHACRLCCRRLHLHGRGGGRSR